SSPTTRRCSPSPTPSASSAQTTPPTPPWSASPSTSDAAGPATAARLWVFREKPARGWLRGPAAGVRGGSLVRRDGVLPLAPAVGPPLRGSPCPAQRAGRSLRPRGMPRKRPALTHGLLKGPPTHTVVLTEFRGAPMRIRNRLGAPAEVGAARPAYLPARRLLAKKDQPQVRSRPGSRVRRGGCRGCRRSRSPGRRCGA